MRARWPWPKERYRSVVCVPWSAIGRKTSEVALPPARIISPEASPTMPTGKVCCLYCYLASLYKRSLQANNVFLLLCIRGDKCTSVTHDQWVRVRSIVSNVEKTCDECTPQRSTTRHFRHCTPTHKYVLLMILHIPQASTCRRRAHTSLICADRRDTGGRAADVSMARLHRLRPLQPLPHPYPRKPPANRTTHASRTGSTLQHRPASSI